MPALLLDLDDTLLHNSMGDFLPRYFGALSGAVAHLMEREPFLRALQAATRQMMTDTGDDRTNEQVFWAHFEPMLPVSRAEIMPVLNQFYDETFPGLNTDTSPMTGARELVAAAKAAGWRVVVATNPLFPAVAMRHRLAWAQLNPDEFDLITAYENMTSTKPHPTYYREIAAMLGLEPSECVMAGNHLSNDILGAAQAGMRTFWVTEYGIDDADVVPDGQGTLDELREWLFG